MKEYYLYKVQYYTFSFFIIFIFFACSKNSEKPIDEVNDLAAYFDGKNGALYVKKSYENEVLDALNAEQLNDTVYQINAGDFSESLTGQINFTIFNSDNPYIFSVNPESLMPKSLTFIIIKVYSNAQCGQLNPGFTAPCQAVPNIHPKAGRYKSMDWWVRDWYSCTSGNSLCIEVLSKVGQINYYFWANCLDTFSVAEDILRFECWNP
jgi:hypothetical protein